MRNDRRQVGEPAHSGQYQERAQNPRQECRPDDEPAEQDAIGSEKPQGTEGEMKVVISESGKAFDPRVVDLLSKHYIQWERLAQEKSVQVEKLSTHVKVERGVAPAAGFEASTQTTP